MNEPTHKPIPKEPQYIGDYGHSITVWETLHEGEDKTNSLVFYSFVEMKYVLRYRNDFQEVLTKPFIDKVGHLKSCWNHMRCHDFFSVISFLEYDHTVGVAMDDRLTHFAVERTRMRRPDEL